MLLETFEGTDLSRVMDQVCHALGDDALVVRSQVERRGKSTHVRVVAASAAEVERLHRRLVQYPPTLPRATGGRGRSGPAIIAFVGPSGSGKTSTLVKLALNRDALPAQRVGVLTLDTYRVAALEHLQQYAEVGNLLLEAVYDEREIAGALSRLETCDAVLVDTPGRSPCDEEANSRWQELLRRVAPDETHLVLPATHRPDGIEIVRRRFGACEPTHLLVTRDDEIWSEDVLMDVVLGADLPLRWITDGHRVPDDIRMARARVLEVLGVVEGRRVTATAA